MADEVAESVRLVYTSIGEEVFATAHAAVDGQKYGLNHIKNVHEGDILPTVSGCEIQMTCNTFNHQEIVFFAWTVDACWPKNDVWKVVSNGIEEAFGLQFAFTIRRIGQGSVVFVDFGKRFLFPDGTKHTQRTDVDEPLEGHLQLQNSIHQVLGTFGVDTVKIVRMNTFGDAGGMNDIVESMPLELLNQSLFR